MQAKPFGTPECKKLGLRDASLSSVTFLPGFAVYFAAVLLPGYGLGEFLERWRSDDSPLERIGLALGYGISFDTVVFAVATSGLHIGSLRLAGLAPGVIYVLVGSGLALLGGSLYRKRKLQPTAPFSNQDVLLLLCLAFIAGFAWLYFQKYPIFPTFYNPDFLAIVRVPAGLIEGGIVTIPELLLYGAGHYQTAAAFLAVGTSNLPTAQHAMAILATASPLIVYAAANRLFANRRTSILATMVYAFSGTIWVQMVYSDGLYPNFIGVLIQMVAVVAFLDLASNIQSTRAWLASGVVLLAAYFSHYTVLAMLGSFLLYSAALSVAKKPGSRNRLAASLIFVAPVVIGLIAFFQTFLNGLAVSYTSGASQPLTTPLSSALSFIPSLALLAFDVRNDIGFLAMLVLLTAGLYRAKKTNDASISLPAVWFFGLLVAAPQDYAAWRFSLEAIVPLTLLSGYGMAALMPSRRISKIRRLKTADPYKFGTAVVALLFLTAIAAPGWASTYAQTLVPGAQAQAQVQHQVLQAMNWLGENTTSSSAALSITDPTFLYTGLFSARNCSYAFIANETTAISYAQRSGFEYLVVTHFNVYFNLLSPAPDDSSITLPWFTYAQTQNAKLIFSNPDVKIFQVANASP